MPSFWSISALLVRISGLIFFGLCSFAHAQSTALNTVDVAASTDRPWQIQSYATAAALTQHRVFDITFTQNGTAWLASSNGLWSFDGYRWRSYGTEDGLPSRFVRCVTVSRQAELWVGTDRGAGVFDPVTKRFDRRGTDTNLPNQNVRTISEFSDGSLWFCCDQWPDTSVSGGGIARYVDGTWSVFTKRNGLPLDYIMGCYRTRRGEAYAFTPRGWSKQLGSQWIPMNPGGDQVDSVIVQMAEDANGRLFVQGENHLFTLDGNFATIVAGDSVLVTGCADGSVISLRREPSRNTVTFDEWDGTDFQPVSAAVAVSPNARFYRLAEAPDGAVWCVGQGIVLRWSRQNAWTHYPQLPPLVTIDRRGNPWFAGNGQVLWHDQVGFHPVPGLSSFVGIDKDDTVVGRDEYGRLVTLPNLTAAKGVVADCPVTTITHVQNDLDKTLWLAGRDASGKVVFSYRDKNEWHAISSPSLANRILYSVQASDAGGIIAVLFPPQSTDFELVRVNIEGVQPVDLGNDRPAVPYPAVHARGDNLIVSGYAGVYERTGDNGPWHKIEELSGNSFSGAFTGPAPDLVFAFQNDQTTRGGLALRHDNTWRQIYGEYDAPSIDPYTQRLQVTARARLYRQLEPGALEFDLLALPEDAYIQRAATDNAGSTWLNTTSGVFAHAPDRSAPMPIVRAGVTDLAASTALKLDLQARQRYEVESPTHAFQFSYRVDSDAWSSYGAGGERTIPVSGLSAGKHRLEVTVRNSDGIVSTEPASIDFTVQPVPLQNRRWFPLALAGLLGVIGFLAWLGISRARAVVLSHRELAREFAERERAEQALADALAELKQAHNELENRVAERTTELSSANEALRNALAEREQSERTRAALEHQLREAQKMEAIGTLAGGIAHDFNNILTVIIPCTGIALDDTKHIPGVRENLTQVLQAAERAKNLVQQILAFSRRQKPEQRAIDVRGLVKETHTLLRSAIPSTIAVHLRLSNEVPLVLADGTQLHQVLMNLCTNARHAVPVHGGIITITVDTITLSDQDVRLSSDLPAGLYVRVSVEDNGKGISADILPRIFEPFFTTKAPGEGTGLGLSVAHGIVKDHHGVIRVFSREGHGTRFDVLLPPATATQVEVVANESAPSSGHGEHILIVDDEFMVSRIVSQVLSRMGYRPSVHTRPEVALNEYFKNPNRFHLLITDLTMPGMNGLELARAIRGSRPELPVILMTGYGGDVPPGVESREVDLVIFKPFEASALVLEIEKLLKRKRPPALAVSNGNRDR